MPDEKIIDYVLRYGGRCRDCADEDGICPTKGLPCDTRLAEKAVKKVIDAIKYGVAQGYIDNPLQ